MPLTDFQREVLAVIVTNRSEDSHEWHGIKAGFAGWIYWERGIYSARKPGEPTVQAE